jgi:hypothetical protein
MTTIQPPAGATAPDRLNVLLPSDATCVWPWYFEEDGGVGWLRVFSGTHRGMRADIEGTQRADGTILRGRRWLLFGPVDAAEDDVFCLSASRAREFAELSSIAGHDADQPETRAVVSRALLAAADEMDLLDCGLCLGTGILCEAIGDVICTHEEAAR